MTTFFTRLALAFSLIALLITIAAHSVGTLLPRAQWIPLTFNSYYGEEGGHVYLFDLRYRLLAPLVERRGQINFSALSPDVQTIAYVAVEEGKFTIDLDTIPTSHVIRLSETETSINDSFVWSPDGTQIASNFGTNDADIYTIRLQNREVRRLTYNPYGDVFPAWSPDGNWIAYTAMDSISVPDLHVIDAHCPEHCDAHAHQLTDNGYNDTPAWSPDSRQIAYIGRGQGKYQVNMLDTTCITQKTACRSEQPTLVTLSGFIIRGLVWSDDGQQILIHIIQGNNPALFTVSAACRDESTCQPVPLLVLDPPRGLRW